MINMIVNNLEITSKISWENGQDMANECTMMFLQVLCKIDNVLNNQIKDTQTSEKLRHDLSDILINMLNDFKYDNITNIIQ